MHLLMTTQKILHITNFQTGGAGIATSRLHHALLRHGYESKFLFLTVGKPSETFFKYKNKIYLWDVFLRILKKLGLPLNLEQKNDYLIRKFKRNIEMFSFANTPYTHLHEYHLVKEADVIHLHWISDFVDFKSFFSNIKKPLVWTLHDMNAFQGGFHYEDDKKLLGKEMESLENEQLNIKKGALQHIPSNQLTIVTPSKWMLEKSKQSQLLHRFQHKHIPNGVDINIFKFIPNKKLPLQNRKINVLFVAESLHNHRKGFDFVLAILQKPELLSKCQFTAVGDVRTSTRIPEINYTGVIRDEKRISEIYNGADIFLLPSREDNLPNSMVESLCCGVPMVGFAIGGLTETITNGKNGYLSKEVSADGLANALLLCIENISLFNNEEIAANAHAKFSSEVQVKSLLNIYQNSFQIQPEHTITVE